MGCGCGQRNVVSRRQGIQPTVGPRPTYRGVAAAPTPSQLRLLTMQRVADANPSPPATASMDEKRRKLELMRRATIRRKTG